MHHPISDYVALGLDLGYANFCRALHIAPEEALRNKQLEGASLGAPTPVAATPYAGVEKTLESLSVEDRQVIRATGVAPAEYVKRYNLALKEDAALAARLTPPKVEAVVPRAPVEAALTVPVGSALAALPRLSDEDRVARARAKGYGVTGLVLDYVFDDATKAAP